MAERLTVEVVLAGTGSAVRQQVSLPHGATAWDAVLASGIADMHAGCDPSRLGIFARRVAPDTPVCDGDRVELYRPLRLDPKEARRRRAQDR